MKQREVVLSSLEAALTAPVIAALGYLSARLGWSVETTLVLMVAAGFACTAVLPEMARRAYSERAHSWPLRLASHIQSVVTERFQGLATLSRSYAAASDRAGPEDLKKVPGGLAVPLELLQVDAYLGSIDRFRPIRNADDVREALQRFELEMTLDEVQFGPWVTTFDFRPSAGVEAVQIIDLIVNHQKELAVALHLESVRVERSSSGEGVRVQIPNLEREPISLHPLLASSAFRGAQSLLTVVLGVTTAGDSYFADVAAMPHLILRGRSGAGKSESLKAMITSILFKAPPEQVQLVLIAPRGSLRPFAEVPHAATQLIEEPEQAARALRWTVKEMAFRNYLLSACRANSVDDYNRGGSAYLRERVEKTRGLTPPELLPRYVVVIDDLQDILATEEGPAIEKSLGTLVTSWHSSWRDIGIHLIIATKMASDAMSGQIANRILLATESPSDSQIVPGGWQSLGRGDMLVQHSSVRRVIRLHGPLVSKDELSGLVAWLRRRNPRRVATELPGTTNEREQTDEVDKKTAG